MVYIREGSHVHTLLMILAFTGEYPARSLHLLGSERTWKNLIQKLCKTEEYCLKNTGERFRCKLITVSGKDRLRTVRLHVSALLILEKLNAEAYRYYQTHFDCHHFSGNRFRIDRHHRIAEAFVMCLRAGVASLPHEIPDPNNLEVRRNQVSGALFYLSLALKEFWEGEMNKTKFSRMVGMIVYPRGCYMVYNSRNTLMKWSGNGESKVQSYLSVAFAMCFLCLYGIIYVMKHRICHKKGVIMARKRANGEGSLRQLENGSWMCQLMVGHKPDGTRDIRTFVGKTQKEALHRRDEFKRKMAEGLLLAEDLRFEEWADTWYGNHQDNIKPTTQESYRYTLRILKDHFGWRKLAEIKAMDVEQFLKKLRKDGRSHSYIAQCRGMLFQIFNKAVANDILMKNPVAYADKMRKQPPKSKEAFTADEMRKLFEELPDDRIGWSIRLQLATGMRTQELLALEPRHISADGSSINIAQAVVRIKGTVDIGTPKSNDSYRTIPVPEFVRYCARNLRDTDKKFI